MASELAGEIKQAFPVSARFLYPVRVGHETDL